MRTVRGVCRVDLRGQIRLRLRCRTCGLPWPHGSDQQSVHPGAGVRPYELVGRGEFIDGFDVALQRSGLRLAARSKILYGLRGLARPSCSRSSWSTPAAASGLSSKWRRAPGSR